MIFESAPKILGMGYAIVALLLLSFVLKKQKFTKLIRYIFLFVTTGAGFLIFAPSLPVQFQNLLVLRPDKISSQYLLLIVGVLAFIGLTLLLGRIFCGYLFPFGAIQEIAYWLSTQKFKISSKKALTWIHALVFVVFLVMGIFLSKTILGYFGLRHFFYLRVATVFFYVFLGIVLTSIFVYRPFCRGICPYGYLLSLASAKSRYELTRTDRCTDCGLCEVACPTDEAKRGDSKAECYLCGRCIDACPVDAIEYSRSHEEDRK